MDQYAGYYQPQPMPTYEHVSPYIGLCIVLVFTVVILRLRWLAKHRPSRNSYRIWFKP